jgi:predicted 2-oxoglutarate/Fe(II)-dependent dioxygenase YbiX
LRIFTVPDAMDAASCRRVRAAMDAGVPEPAEVLDETITVQEEVRRASQIDVPEMVLEMVEQCLDRMLDAIAAFYRLSLHSREGASFLRYETGGFYKPHVDRARVASWPSTERRQITTVLFLDSSREAEPSGGFSGGLLRVFPNDGDDPIEITPRQGTLVAFPATMRHEVTRVTSGRRDTVVDWFY